MMRRWSVLAVAAVACGVGAGCRRRTEQPQLRDAAPAPQDSPVARAAPDAGPPRSPHRRAPLIVGSAKGLVEIGLDGTVGRRIAAGPARHPRFVGADQAVVLAVADDQVGARVPVEVRRVSLRTGETETVGRFPAFRCRPDSRVPSDDGGPPDGAVAEPDDEPALALQSEDELTVAADGRSLCLTRMDRNLNMADVILSARMDLQTGAVLSRLTLGGTRCPAPPGVEVSDEVPCDPQPHPHDDDAGDDASVWPFHFDKGRLLRREGGAERPVATLRGFAEREDRSPSGRWLVVSGNQHRGDYVYRSLLLLDRREGALFPIPRGALPWPAPLNLSPWRPAQAARQAVTVTGEDDVFWLPGAAPEEALIVKRMLVVPGRAAIKLPGDVAR